MSESPLRFLVDHNVGRGVAQFLVERVHDAIFVGNVDLHMPDRDILDWALRDRRIILTQDHDFGALIHHSGESHAGILLLRMGHARREERIAVMRWILKEHAADLPGCFCVYANGRLRVRC